MADIAQLGLAVDSSQVEKGTIELTKLSGAAQMAEGAAQALAAGNQNASTSAARMAAATNQEAAALSAATAASRLNTMAMQANAAAVRMASMQQKNLIFQLNDIGVSLASGMNPLMVLIQQGSQISQIYGPNEGGVGRAFKETGNLILGAITKFPLLTAAVAATAAGFAGLTYEINQSTDVAVGFGDVMLATVQVVTGALYDQLKPAIDAIAPWFASAWELVVSGVKLVGNTIINSFRAAFEDLRFVFVQFPNIVAVAIGGAANLVVSGVESMINVVTGALDTVIGKINVAFASMPDWAKPDGGFQIGTIGAVKLGRVDIGSAGADLAAAAGNRNSRIADIMNNDPLGEAFDAIKAKAIENALKGVEKAAGGAGDALKKAAEDAKDPWEGLRQTTNKINERFLMFRDTVSEAFQGIGSTISQALQSGASLWDAFEQAGLNALDSITSKLLDMAANQLIDQLLNALGNTVFFNPTPNGFGNMLGIPAHAAGTSSASAGLALVGERGPELVRFRGGEQVVPNSELRTASNQNQAPVINIHNNGAPISQDRQPQFDGRVLDLYITAKVDDRMKKNMKPTLQSGFGITPKVSRRS